MKLSLGKLSLGTLTCAGILAGGASAQAANRAPVCNGNHAIADALGLTAACRVTSPVNGCVHSTIP